LKRIVFRTAGIGTYKGTPPEETRNLLKIPNIVADDYTFIGISAIPFTEDALNF
jgi:hypothetical protein